MYRLVINTIFCFDPRLNDNGEWYADFINYKNSFGAKIIQRVGDLGTHSKPELTDLVKKTMPLSDFIIFPSRWAKDWIGYERDNYVIINNRPLEIFHKNKINKKLDSKVNLITHHWSTNPKKGFNYYLCYDSFVRENPNFSFTYVGRLPTGFVFESSKYVSPIDVNEISLLLPKYDIYVTASIEEAGANHVLEALASGLPVLYHKGGGSIVEYCKNYGEGYDSYESFLKALGRVVKDYDVYKQRVLGYNETVEKTISDYIGVINAL